MAAVNTLNMYTLMRGFYLNHVSSQNTWYSTFNKKPLWPFQNWTPLRQPKNLDCSWTKFRGELKQETQKILKTIAAFVRLLSSCLHYTLQICIKKVEKFAVINKQFYTLSLSPHPSAHSLGTCPVVGQMCIHTAPSEDQRWVTQTSAFLKHGNQEEEEGREIDDGAATSVHRFEDQHTCTNENLAQ